MSTFRHPVGSQPPNVYWRRRLVVGIGALVVLIVILLIVFVPKGGTPATQHTSNPPTDPSTSATAPACAADALTVTASSDKAKYAAGELPQLSYTVTNNGAAACTIDADPTKQEFLITSGKQKEKYWSSKDCQTDAATAVPYTIEAGKDVSSSVPVEWDRTRSSTTTCDGGRTAVPSGATYQLTITIDGVASKPIDIVLS
ncbi:hypothetical protein QT381_01240 [Galbitalea sp. SE-J8]|uniref:hypothetical protein n=1 Tax=Galbitalea sp. SE-J8 TaxID=3054952 RepID=UPI00259D2887|nr:hypothetical protein [Galbitalea sp. SE-J8]MDM4761632.1 hypothetical protein [Galbitalea sp. SE-J8]